MPRSCGGGLAPELKLPRSVHGKLGSSTWFKRLCRLGLRNKTSQG